MPENIVLTEATYYILLSLCDPQHGYGIMQEAERLSEIMRHHHTCTSPTMRQTSMEITRFIPTRAWPSS